MGNIADKHMARELNARLDEIEQMISLGEFSHNSLCRRIAKAIAFISTGITDVNGDIATSDPDRDARLIHGFATLQVHICKGEERRAHTFLSGLRHKVRKMENNLDN